MTNRNHVGIDTLPATLPLFPLSGVLLLPRGRLPLNVFEPRYLNLTDDALAGDRLIGMIQPTELLGPSSPANPPLRRIGCAGRITSFSEEGDRYLITLTGICRFDVVDEEVTPRLYRRAKADWAPYAGDLDESPAPGIDRSRLIADLKIFFQQHGLSADWESIRHADEERLVTSLAMICPFPPEDKQALLEAKDLKARSRLLIGLIEMANLNPASPGAGLRH